MSAPRSLRVALRGALLPTELLALLLAAGCQPRTIEERWPETGLRRLTGRVEVAQGERRTASLWTFWYPDGLTQQARGWYEGGPLPDLTVIASGGTRVPVEGRTKRWSFWDASGTLLAEGKFAQGLRDDLWACWREDGELCCTGSFEGGRPTGFHVVWSDRVRRDEHYYVDGVLDGPRVVRDPAGAVVWTGEYRRGELLSGQPSGVPEPPLLRIEDCAAAAEEGQRLPLADPLGTAQGG